MLKEGEEDADQRGCLNKHKIGNVCHKLVEIHLFADLFKEISIHSAHVPRFLWMQMDQVEVGEDMQVSY